MRRRTGVSSTVLRKRKRPQNKKNSKSKKKECELGEKCPYQNEHQHRQEFAHTLPGSRESIKATTTLSTQRKSRYTRGKKLGGKIRDQKEAREIFLQKVVAKQPDNNQTGIRSKSADSKQQCTEKTMKASQKIIVVE
mmetsp:Transcript_310/g.488  ORF Transcript_310/g.488 Transcript_310/m.488 type:complete len:137 (+) Transcript_310:273-683(+)